MAVFDKHGYIVLNVVRDYGVSENNADNYSNLAALMASPYRTEIVGEAGKTYILSKPIYGTEKYVKFAGTWKIKDGIIVSLTHDFTNGTNTLQLTNAATYFIVGNHVSISDDDRAIQGGGTGQTRRESRSFIITDITGDIITFDTNTNVGFSVSKNAKIGHTQNVLIYDNVDKFVIDGNCTFDGNKSNQYDVEPVFTTSGENDKMGCGISIYNSDDWEVRDGVKLQNCLLHGAAINYVYRGKFLATDISAIHDKGILVRHAYDCEFDDLVVDNVEFEDAITMYDTAVRCKIRRLKATNCGRSGIVDNDHNTNCEIEDCNIDTYGYAYSLMNTTTIFKGVNIFKSTGQFRYGASRRQVFRAYLIKNATIDLNGAKITGGKDGLAGLHIQSCENIKVKNAEVYEVSSDYAACYASSLVTTNAYFENINVHDNVCDNYGNDVNTTLIIT